MPKDPVIKQVLYFPPNDTECTGATLGILWSTGTTDFYPWHNYPHWPDLRPLEPHYQPPDPFFNRFRNITFSRAPNKWSWLKVNEYNHDNYVESNIVSRMSMWPNPVPRLETMVDEVDYLTRKGLLFPKKMTGP